MKPWQAGVRTFFQSFLGTLIGTGALSAVEADGIVDWTILTKALVSALAAGLIGFISWAQNALEKAGAIPGAFK